MFEFQLGMILSEKSEKNGEAIWLQTFIIIFSNFLLLAHPHNVTMFSF